MAISKTFFDANVPLEVLLGRSNADACEQLIKSNPGWSCISALTVHLIMHFGTQASISENVLDDFINGFEVLPFDKTHYDFARRLPHKIDFEDRLQLAIAIDGGCDTFYTLNKKLARDTQGIEHIDIKLLVS